MADPNGPWFGQGTATFIGVASLLPSTTATVGRSISIKRLVEHGDGFDIVIVESSAQLTH